ncbi:metallophosphoesterase [Bordetella bronchiseptica]|uniref:metallophosphoesterase n=1 Tax=Bordetella bronchiseptica TaxID=518 RepID=UPI0013631A47|nr:metallophosphoesterase [Bordetella bronchiseptica]
MFSVGDLADRGPESVDVLKWLERPWFHAICGNHDRMTWRRAMGDPIPDVDHRAHGGGWLDACVGDVRERMRTA